MPVTALITTAVRARGVTRRAPKSHHDSQMFFVCFDGMAIQYKNETTTKIEFLVYVSAVMSTLSIVFW